MLNSGEKKFRALRAKKNSNYRVVRKKNSERKKKPRFGPTIYRTRGEHAGSYATDALLHI